MLKKCFNKRWGIFYFVFLCKSRPAVETKRSSAEMVLLLYFDDK